MCALLRRILKEREDLWLFGGFVIMAANAGGAWSPIGDVTTIMLWIGGQVTTLNIIKATFLASGASILVPLILASIFIKKNKIEVEPSVEMPFENKITTTPFERNFLLFFGIGLLLMVPVFKYLTHLPPYMGVLFALGMLWFITELLHWKKDP
jgi:Na+/H+ antiporter NhaD/arsenite permease-like protein